MGKQRSSTEGLNELAAVELTRRSTEIERRFAIISSCRSHAVGPTGEQAVRWNPDAWRRGLHDVQPLVARIDRLADVLTDRTVGEDGWRWISRNDAFHAKERGPMNLFVAAMAWGFGPRAYGWHRTGVMLGAFDKTTVAVGEEAASRLVEVLAARADPADAWRAWSSGATRVPGMGTAFASKVAYFAAYDRITGMGPLICDANTPPGRTGC